MIRITNDKESKLKRGVVGRTSMEVFTLGKADVLESCTVKSTVFKENKF